MKKPLRITKFLPLFIVALLVLSLGFQFVRHVVAQGSNESFTIAVLPDTQFYAQDYPDIFTDQTQWIVNNKALYNIAFVAHEGDIVQVRSQTVQWDVASAAMGLLEDPVTTSLASGIPYSVVAGNHDDYPIIDTYNQYFGVSRFQGRSYYGGQFPTGDNQNNYSFFSAGGMDFIVVGIDSIDPAAGNLEWADGILKTYSDRRAIVVSHAIIGADASFDPFGQQIYDTLKNNPNLFLMLCGHVGGSQIMRTDTYNGNKVYTLLADFQSSDPLLHGGDGWLRLLTFVPKNNQIEVKTYSPYLDQWQTEANNQFVLPYDMNGDLPAVTSVTRLNFNPSNLNTVHYSVTFNTDVTGVDTTDFSVYSTGSITGPSVTSVSGSGKQYYVSVNTGTGEGTLRLDVVDDDTIVDSIGKYLGGVGLNNGNYSTGEVYTIDRITPTSTFSYEPSTVSFPSIGDVILKQDFPNTNYGYNTTLNVDNSPVEQILTKFNVTGTSGKIIASAKLRMYATAGSIGTGGIVYQTADSSWIEKDAGGVTWNTAPAANPTPIVDIGPVAAETWVEVDLTSIVTADGPYSFRITSNSTDGASYNSREAATNTPELVLQVVDIPSPTPTKTSTPTKTPTSTKTLLPTLPPVGPGTYDDASPKIDYTGWLSQSVAGNYAKTEHYSSVIGKSASFTFTGNSVTIVYRGYPSIFGNMTVEVDGLGVGVINQNTPTQQFQLKATYSGLTNGVHTVVLTHTSGKYVALDAIIVGGPPTATPTATNTPTSTNTPTLVPTLAPVGPGTYDDASPNVVYTGWLSQTVSSNYAKTEHYSSVIGKTASFTFTGNSLTIVYRGYPSIFGNMTVKVDGVEVGVINQNTPTQQFQLKATYSGLSDDPHTVVLTHTSGKYVALDAIIVGGPPTATPTATNTPTSTNTPTPLPTLAPVGPGTYDDASPKVLYTGWLSQSVSGNYAKTEHYSSVIGKTATFTFTGNSVTIVYRGYPSIFGTMTVEVDGAEVGVIDQNTPTQQFQLKATYSGLSDDPHTLVLTHTSGKYVALDAIIVTGPPTATPTATNTPTSTNTPTPLATLAPVGPGTYDDASPKVVYTGWLSQTVTGNYAKTEHYSSVIGKTATFTFTGNSVTIVYRGYPSVFGTMTVEVDGAEVGVIDQNTPTQQFQLKTTYSDLSDDPHTLVLTHTSGKYVALDAIIVTVP